MFVTPRRREQPRIEQALNAHFSKTEKRFEPTAPASDEAATRERVVAVAALPHWKENAPLSPGSFFLIAFTTGGDYRAFAAPSSRFRSHDAPEYCVCPDDCPPITIAHEILHLFGARDL